VLRRGAALALSRPSRNHAAYRRELIWLPCARLEAFRR